jgi:hypothetical protein
MRAEKPIGRRLAALIAAAAVVLTWPTPVQAATRPGAGPSAALPYYFLITSTQSGKCLAVAEASTDDDAHVVQQTCSDTAYNQHWSFLSVDRFHYVMVVRHSGKCLAVAEASTDDGALAVQRTCAGDASQHWSFPYVGGNNYLAVARHSNKCLTAAEAGTPDGAPVIQWTCRAGAGQQWRLGY